MKCLTCGAGMVTKREVYRYDEAVGLPDVRLQDVEVSRCPRCGETEVAIPNIEGLHRAIAMSLVGKRQRLMPHEVRFLRKYLGLSQADFAARIGADPDTVSRWETRGPIGTQADKLLRLMVATHKPPDCYPPLQLETIAVQKAKSIPMALKARGDRWQVNC